MSRGLDLDRPRDLNVLFSDALRVYFRHLPTFLALAALIVVPAHVVVSGIGLEELTAGYDSSPPLADSLIPLALSFLVVSPLITATCIHALHEAAAGRRPPVGRSIAAGFEAFAPIFVAVLLAAAGITLGLVLILPGIYLLIRWYFVPQAVVLESARGTPALAGSWALVEGFWWRTAGIVLLANLATAIPGLLFTGPFTALASSTDRAVFGMIGTILAQVAAAPFVALLSTLLYYDLRARRRARPDF